MAERDDGKAPPFLVRRDLRLAKFFKLKGFLGVLERRRLRRRFETRLFGALLLLTLLAPLLDALILFLLLLRALLLILLCCSKAFTPKR